MEGEFMSKKNRLPEIIIFAGPNGSGKTTITRMARTIGVYINADDIKRSSLCSDLEAAVKAEELREEMIEKVCPTRSIALAPESHTISMVSPI